MNYSKKIILISLSSLCLLHMGKESSIESTQHPDINFQGTILFPSAQYNKTLAPLLVDNITIGGNYKKIIVFLPQEAAEPTDPKRPHQKKLASNPKNGIKFELDLDQLDKIAVADKKEYWIYTKKNKRASVEYIEITVHFKNDEHTVKHYLIERTRKIKAREIDNNVYLETGFAGIDEIIFTGYTEKDIVEAPAEKKIINNTRSTKNPLH